MKSRPNNRQPLEELSETAVVEYLQQHPAFFTQHEELLAMMEIPHASGTAVSLVERKLAVLREENQQLQYQLNELVTIAQQNEQLNQRIQRLIATLTRVTTLEEFFDNLYSTLCHEFNTDAVVLRWFELPHATLAKRQEFVEYDAQVFTLFENLLASEKPLCGQLSTEQTGYLFPNNSIASAALIPLGTPKSQGLLAIGSRDASRFHASMGTDLLKHLGELIGYLLEMWLRPHR